MSALLRFSLFSAATALLAGLCAFSVEPANAGPFTISFSASPPSGPITIADYAGQSAQLGWLAAAGPSLSSQRASPLF